MLRFNSDHPHHHTVLSLPLPNTYFFFYKSAGNKDFCFILHVFSSFFSFLVIVVMVVIPSNQGLEGFKLSGEITCCLAWVHTQLCEALLRIKLKPQASKTIILPLTPYPIFKFFKKWYRRKIDPGHF